MSGHVSTVLSLGAGVQSSALLLMCEHGEIPRPDLAIFADPGWEGAATYAWLDELENLTTIPIKRVSGGDLRERTLASKEGERFAPLPLWVASPLDGREAPLRRQCTKEFKIEPVVRGIREHLGYRPRQRVKGRVLQFLGISIDEVSRMKPSRIPWLDVGYPLIDAGISRWDCIRWMEAKGYPRPPRSACIGCPYRDNAGWRAMKEQSPAEWDEAVEFDRQIRSGLRGVEQEAYIHRSLQPLDQVDFSSAEDRGQVNMFNMECEGMCGV